MSKWCQTIIIKKNEVLYAKLKLCYRKMKFPETVQRLLRHGFNKPPRSVKAVLRNYTCFTSRGYMSHFLDGTFPDYWFGKDSTLPWPPHSSDTTPLDFLY
ncbi:hypothetical protein HNY73_003306 [Argiope bruennichi]|uniref:Uncharacterized protein n=1 Tax=Argiope bruennichi TaxID=94029 RepID=A0A8T0FWK5_ARGBR|nr:hypothetical protein HNY73_003306 [Argiope bruennichi]